MITKTAAAIGALTALAAGIASAETNWDMPVAYPADNYHTVNAQTFADEVAESAGLVPTQIEAAELKQALSTGVVASFISSGSTGVDEKVWEDLTHFYDAKAWLPRNTVFANAGAFAELSADEQGCLTEKAAEAQARGSATAAELADGFVATLAENGMNVAEPGDALAGDLAGIGETMTGEWLEQAGDDGAAIVDAFRAE